MSLEDLFPKLKGKTLHTLSRGKPFTIHEVFSYEINIVTSTGKNRSVKMNEIQEAWCHLKKYKNITRIEIEEKYYSLRNSAYVFAILSKIPMCRSIRYQRS